MNKQGRWHEWHGWPGAGRGVIKVKRRWYGPAPGDDPGSVIMTMKMPKNLGTLLLAIWLILFGLLTAPFLSVSFAHSGDLLAALGIAAGVLLLLQR